MRPVALLLLLGACAAPARLAVARDEPATHAAATARRPSEERPARRDAAAAPVARPALAVTEARGDRDRAWRVVRIGAAGVAVVAAFFLAFAPFDAAHDSPFAGHSLAVGLGLAAIGGVGIGLSTWQLSLPLRAPSALPSPR